MDKIIEQMSEKVIRKFTISYLPKNTLQHMLSLYISKHSY